MENTHELVDGEGILVTETHTQGIIVTNESARYLIRYTSPIARDLRWHDRCDLVSYPGATADDKWRVRQEVNVYQIARELGGQTPVLIANRVKIEKISDGWAYVQGVAYRTRNAADGNGDRFLRDSVQDERNMLCADIARTLETIQSDLHDLPLDKLRALGALLLRHTRGSRNNYSE